MGRETAAVFLGVRHHSPACARLVARTIASLQPAHVLVEGPADMNDRLDELLLGHRLPVAVFSHYRDAGRTATSWTPLCDYSPEWVALQHGRAAGAQVRFVDLPAWHPAFTERPEPLANRFADAEARYAEATRRLCERFGADSADALWDGLVEVGAPDGPSDGPDGPSGIDGSDGLDGLDWLARRLDVYFDLVRGDARAEPGDRAREEYMAGWVRAALARDEGPVLVVTGGFHTPALRTLASVPAPATAPAAAPSPATDWPEVPQPPDGAQGGSFLVPYSFRQLDAFAGYQSGMPSPGYYQLLWEHGPAAAAEGLLEQVVRRLRGRRLPVSTADLIAARTLADGLAALRGHRVRSRTDVLDGLVGALVGEALEQPLPWTAGGALTPGTHPVVVEMVAASTGDRIGRLHPRTPAPPLVHDVAARSAHCGVLARRPADCDLTTADGLERSRLLHRLRVLAVPGHVRTAGPETGADPVFTEHWEPAPSHGREAALIEAGAYGARLDEAAAVALATRAREAVTGAPDEVAAALAGVLFDAVLCGADTLSADLLTTLADRVRALAGLGATGDLLATALHLWRHDRIYGVAGDPLLADIVDAAVGRVFWLAEGLHGSGGVVDPGRLRAVAAARDALRLPDLPLALPRAAAVATARRIAADHAAPPDLRGAALGLCWSLGPGPAATTAPSQTDGAAAVPVGTDAVREARLLAAGDPGALGDWLAGLFALARDELTGLGTTPQAAGPSLLDTLDELVTAMTGDDFLTGLPALRQAFAFFPPRERERIAERLLERRGVRGSARTLLRTTADPLLLARARSLEENVIRLLDRSGLRPGRAAR
ncbi:DUF5682 family protein [Kitasatospora sp. NPDC048365]|uniref:DUF5682 family protein n=1 Tax=Kitasatospora sp. NPDC048365 TaxID=3364050 RepID=UPI0037212D7D